MSQTAESAYAQLIDRVKQARLLGSCAEVLGWDEQTYMPPKGGAHRAEQMALLARLTHEMLTAPVLGELLGSAEGSANPEDTIVRANLREIRRAYDRAVKLPADLVAELARTTTRAQQIWRDARKANDFAAFAPWLEKIVHLKRREAQAVGYQAAPYDALLDEYEPGATTADLTALFAQLRSELTPLIHAIVASGKQPRTDILEREYPLERQKIFGQAAAAALGFDFTAGRLDVAAHPFCSGLGPGDCRLTTRYSVRHFNEGFFSILHEAGHGIYDQGLKAAEFGTPAGSAASLGIHESQSRLWENQVGRGRPFWEHFFPRARQTFVEALHDVNLEDFLFAINDVRPSFIRVEADEATYNLHIILRFEMEQALINGELSVADVPAAWNQKFQQSFGMTPPTNALGCLQDVHWSCGGIGYFPTYTLGNLYAAQFMEQARQDLPGLEDDFRRGEFGRLKGWLNEKVHRPGQVYRPQELCRRVTGATLDQRPLMKYLQQKYAPLYGL